jgi:uncharacterized protein YbaP (TraB family)
MTRFLFAILLVGPVIAGMPTAARADVPPVCQGKDLVAELQQTDPATYDAVMAEAAKVPNADAEFWRIEKDGLRPSWLLGTAHVTDPRVTTLTPDESEALESSSKVVLELAELKNQHELMAATMKNAEILLLPVGKSLWDLVPNKEEHFIRDNPNLPPGMAKNLYGYKPWTVAMMLTIPPCEVARKRAGVAVLDQIIGSRAARSGKPVLGLESMSEQLHVLDDMPADMQMRYLLAVARMGKEVPDYFETLLALYDRRQTAAYRPFAILSHSAGTDDAALMAYFEDSLIRERNHRMASRAEDILAGGGAFIAVGAMHLIGEEGLVALFRQAGYTVTPVN